MGNARWFMKLTEIELLVCTKHGKNYFSVWWFLSDNEEGALNGEFENLNHPSKAKLKGTTMVELFRK